MRRVGLESGFGVGRSVELLVWDVDGFEEMGLHFVFGFGQRTDIFEDELGGLVNFIGWFGVGVESLWYVETWFDVFMFLFC